MNTILHISVVVLPSVGQPAGCKTLLPFYVLAGIRKEMYSRLSARDFTVVFLSRLY